MGAIQNIPISNRDKILMSNKDGWKDMILDEIKFHDPLFCEFSESLNKKAKAILPLTLKDQKLINRLENQHFFRQNSISPSDRTMAICDNKKMFSDYLEKQGFGSYLPKQKIQEPPYIIKPKTGQWGLDIHIVRSKNDEESLQHILGKASHFKQEFIEGSEEYTTHFLYHKKFYLFRTYEFGYDTNAPIKGIEMPYKFKRLINHETFRPLFEDILKSLDYQGIGCFNYKLVDDKPKIFEMNPRFGASLCGMIDDAIEAYLFALFERKYGLV